MSGLTIFWKVLCFLGAALLIGSAATHVLPFNARIALYVFAAIWVLMGIFTEPE